MSIFTVLTILFITLKLVGTIDWSWWWIVSPTILQYVLVVLVLIIKIWIKKLEK
jgi:hypothetical protein